MKKHNIVLKVLDTVVFLAMTAIILVVTLQILGRTPLIKQAPHWTEELSRIIFIFIVAFGAIAGAVRNEFVSVDIFTSMLKGKVKLIYNTIFDFLLSAFFLGLIPAGLKFIKLGSMQSSPSLRINMSYIHSLIFISLTGMGIAMLYRGIVGIVKIKNYKEDKADE